MNDPNHHVIKVTDGEGRAYFVHFDRVSHDLISVWKYERLVSPQHTSALTPRTKQIVDLAKTLIDMPPEETNGAKQ